MGNSNHWKEKKLMMHYWWYHKSIGLENWTMIMIFLYFKKLTHPSNLRCALLCLSDGSAIAFNQKLTNYVKNSKIHAFPSAKKQAIFFKAFWNFFFHVENDIKYKTKIFNDVWMKQCIDHFSLVFLHVLPSFSFPWRQSASLKVH